MYLSHAGHREGQSVCSSGQFAAVTIVSSTQVDVWDHWQCDTCRWRQLDVSTFCTETNHIAGFGLYYSRRALVASAGDSRFLPAAPRRRQETTTCMHHRVSACPWLTAQGAAGRHQPPAMGGLGAARGSTAAVWKPAERGNACRRRYAFRLGGNLLVNLTALPKYAGAVC